MFRPARWHSDGMAMVNFTLWFFCSCCSLLSLHQWSFRGGTRGNAVPIVKIPLERMGTAFPLLSYGENAFKIYTSKNAFCSPKRCFLDPKIWQNALAAGAPPRTPLGELTTDPLVGWGGDTPPRPDPAQCLRHFDSRAFGAQFLRSHCC